MILVLTPSRDAGTTYYYYIFETKETAIDFIKNQHDSLFDYKIFEAKELKLALELGD